MYKVIDRKKKQLLIQSDEYKSILTFLIKYLDYKKEKHLITLNDKEIPLSYLLKLKKSIDRQVGKSNIYYDDQYRYGDYNDE